MVLHISYLKELTDYSQDQISKISDSVEDRQSRIAGLVWFYGISTLGYLTPNPFLCK